MAMGGMDHMKVRIVAGADDLALLTRQLRLSMLELDVPDVQLVAGDAPDGAKGGLASALGWLWVTIGGEAIKVIVDRIAESARNSGREVEVTLNGQTLHLKHATREQQDQAFQEWLDHVTAAAGKPLPALEQERGYL
jgi:hypothetical protein